MLKKIAKIIEFAGKHPRSFVNINLWARKEVSRGKLTRLADSAGSDKGFRKHMYTRVYEDLLLTKRDSVKTLLEIGLLGHAEQRRIGGSVFASAPSLDMWASYFPQAHIFGLDDKDFSHATGSWAGIIKADQSVRDELKAVDSLASKFDIIIDDGLHASYHQQVSFSFLFSKLAECGIYVIEDLHYQPDHVERERPVGGTLGYLESLKYASKWPSPAATAEERRYIETHVRSVEFFDSMDNGINGARALGVVRKK